MPDETPDQGPDLDPAREADVRRLLAEARHDRPLPPEVAARLDTLLGELVEARSAQTQVTSLAHQRRRRVTLLVAAAAAAVVVGVVGPRLSTGGSAEDSASDSAGSTTSQTRPESAQDQSDAGASADEAAPPAAPEAAKLAEAPVVIGADTFEQDVAAAAATSTVTRSTARPDEPYRVPGCGLGSYGAGTPLPVLYDGSPAVLLLRPSTGPTEVADLLACGTADVIRSTVIPTS